LIVKLSHHNPDTAEKIYAVFQVSYAVEAALLEATDFPPLKRKPRAFMTSGNDFFGFQFEDQLAAVVEVAHNDERTHIQSLVVDPRFFRKGIGDALVEFVQHTFKTPIYTVETGVKNIPATRLYLKHGFQEILQYETDHGVRKVRFEKKRD
jgi:ribosomal protein S18 acetylase RimI-like enzyme